MKQLGERRQFIGFVIVGIVSTCCNLGSRYLFQLWLGYEAAIMAANVVGVLSAFLMNRWLVFRSTHSRFLVEMSRFVLVNIVGIAISWVVAIVLFRHALPAIGFRWHADLVAHAIGIAVPVLPNYLAHRQWTFGKS